jgi:hypothetical protein
MLAGLSYDGPALGGLAGSTLAGGNYVLKCWVIYFIFHSQKYKMQAYIGIDAAATKSVIYGVITVIGGTLPTSLVSVTASAYGSGDSPTDVLSATTYDSETGQFSIEGLAADTQFTVTVGLSLDYPALAPLQMYTAPADPTGVSVYRSDGKLRVFWTPVSGYTYDVIVSNDGWGDVKENVTSPTEFTGLNNGSDYIIRIAVKRQRDIVYTNTYNVPGTWAPTASVLVMGAVTATPLSSAVALSWSGVANATSYIITTEVANAGSGSVPSIGGMVGTISAPSGGGGGGGTTSIGTSQVPAPITVTSPSATVTGLVNGLEYQFSVVAYPGANASVGYSAPAVQTATPVALVAPGGSIVLSTSISSGFLTLTASGATGTVTSYRWEYSTNGGSSFTVMSGTSHVIIVSASDERLYKVTAVNENVDGPSSSYMNINMSTTANLSALSNIVITALTGAQLTSASASALQTLSSSQVKLIETSAIIAMASAGMLASFSQSQANALTTAQIKEGAQNIQSTDSVLANKLSTAITSQKADLQSSLTPGVKAPATAVGDAKNLIYASTALAATLSPTAASSISMMTSPADLAMGTSTVAANILLASSTLTPDTNLSVTAPPGTKAVYGGTTSGGGGLTVSGITSSPFTVKQDADGKPVINGSPVPIPAAFKAVGGKAVSAKSGGSVLVSLVNAPIVEIVSATATTVTLGVILNQLMDVTGATLNVSVKISNSPTPLSTSYSHLITESENTAGMAVITIDSGLTVGTMYTFAAQLVGAVDNQGDIPVAGPISVWTGIVKFGQTIAGAGAYATVTVGTGTITLTASNQSERYCYQIFNTDGVENTLNVTYFMGSTNAYVSLVGTYKVFIYRVDTDNVIIGAPQVSDVIVLVGGPPPVPDVVINGFPNSSINVQFISLHASVQYYNIAWSAPGTESDSVEISVASLGSSWTSYLIYEGVDESKTYTVTVTARHISGGEDSTAVTKIVYPQPVMLSTNYASSSTQMEQITPIFDDNGCDSYTITYTSLNFTTMCTYANLASGIAITTGLPPFGQYIVTFYGIKDGVQSFAYTTSVTLAAAPGGAVCFLGDAPVLTARGYRPIREFRVGDSVMTADGREVAVTRVFSRRYGPSAAVNPYVIPKGVLGATRPLAISPNHEVLVPGTGMVQARDLGLRRMKMAEDFVYYNLELQDWTRDNLVVAGVTVESLAPIKRVSMTTSELVAFVKQRYGPAHVQAMMGASARLKRQ